MTTPEHERAAKAVRIEEFVAGYTTWMKEVAAAARDNPEITASLADLMRQRLAADLDSFVETELRLRVFERRAPEQHPLLQLIETAG